MVFRGQAALKGTGGDNQREMFPVVTQINTQGEDTNIVIAVKRPKVYFKMVKNRPKRGICFLFFL